MKKTCHSQAASTFNPSETVAGDCLGGDVDGRLGALELRLAVDAYSLHLRVGMGGCGWVWVVVGRCEWVLVVE